MTFEFAIIIFARRVVVNAVALREAVQEAGTRVRHVARAHAARTAPFASHLCFLYCCECDCDTPCTVVFQKKALVRRVER